MAHMHKRNLSEWTWEYQIEIMIDQPQILYIQKSGLQSTTEIVHEVSLLKFIEIYSPLHILRNLKCVCLKDWDWGSRKP